MILYTVEKKDKQEIYVDIKKSGDLNQKSIYVNLTNRCPCCCVFCLRQTKKLLESNSLWLKKEPTVEEVLQELSNYDLSKISELVFCGFGEPFERFYDDCKIIDELKKKYPTLKVRANTNGLANLIWKKNICPELKNRFDTISISLNAPSAQEFLDITKSRFGMKSFDEIKKFALEAKKYVPNVVMSVVDTVLSSEKIQECKNICSELGVSLRVRPFVRN